MGAPRLERWIRISSGLPVGLALGAGIWVLSASITGHREPWDSPGMYYAAALLGAGVIGGFLVPGHWAEVAVGVFAGQAVVLLARVLAEPCGVEKHAQVRLVSMLCISQMSVASSGTISGSHPRSKAPSRRAAPTSAY